MEIFGNFPEKYEILRTIFPPHFTSRSYSEEMCSYYTRGNVLAVVYR